MGKIIAIHTTGRRWFTRSLGNTYNSFSVRVRFEDGTEQTITGGMAYGYGDHWETRARNALVDAGIITGDFQPWSLWRYCEENGIFYASLVSDVSRKRDL